MSSTVSSFSHPAGRFGLHYFPDTLHYREADLQTWLPALQELGAAWLVLRSEQGRAIPEHFLRGLKQAGIEPLIQFQLPLDRMPDLKGLGMLLEVYARWGARWLLCYDRPNARASWPGSSWAQQDLVEGFLDRYVPAANLALQTGLLPVFPPLEPGGSYWDMAFLRTALQGLLRRRQEEILQRLVLSAYGWTGGQPLNWGAGGPERWSQARAYLTPTGSQDQRGFRIFDWYQAVAHDVLHQGCPLILLQAGQTTDPLREPAAGIDPAIAVTIAQLLEGDVETEAAVGPTDPNPLDPIPPEVIACAFWLLSAGADSPFAAQAWYSSDGRANPTAGSVLAWRRQWSARQSDECVGEGVPVTASRSIQHYLLLPGYEWGVSDWYLEVIRPFVKKHRPTVGFSAEEAERAAHVTVVGNPQNYPEGLLNRLQNAGCFVEQIGGDGTHIATELAER